jgi:SAM-dependent methyltransferase
MSKIDPGERTRELAEGSVVSGDPTGWFEALYAEANSGQAVVPWDRGAPHPLLADWADQQHPAGQGKRALIVGCGPGYDSEFIASFGFETVAFDIAPSGIRAARDRFPDSSVNYQVADLLDPPAEFHAAFDLVIEIFTVQALPIRLHQPATENVSSFVAPGGTLIVIAAARDEADGPVTGPPWPLTRPEVEAFSAHALQPVLIEHLEISPNSGDYRWRAEFKRPQP